jgi:ubiquitin-conjugating enzyme E2 O
MLSRLRLVRGKTESTLRIGDRVHLKDSSFAPVTTHGSTTDPCGIVEVRTCMVQETQTTVKVLWQDGTHETLPATELIPYLTVDEYDVWQVAPHVECLL